MTTAVKERPILFSSEMVRAILEGRKTQTRRGIKPEWSRCLDLEDEEDRQQAIDQCPYGKPGDLLWVRETWARVNSGSGPGFAYKADSHFIQPEFDGEDFGAGPSFNYEKYPGDYCMWYTDLVGGATADEGYRWTPSIHMPRWASRITLEVTDVRVEKVQDISEEDIASEGTPGMVCGRYQCSRCNGQGEGLSMPKGSCEDCGGTGDNPIGYWKILWNSINGKRDGGIYSWEANPWVWCVSFQVLKGGA